MVSENQRPSVGSMLMDPGRLPRALDSWPAVEALPVAAGDSATVALRVQVPKYRVYSQSH